MLSVQAGRPEVPTLTPGWVVARVYIPSMGKGGDSVETWVGPGGLLASEASQTAVPMQSVRDTAWKVGENAEE